ncbi:MAG: hypothetical protein K2M97_00955 [Muribaculaceae bacterium]|nr:hypothetical protein [Muribaculaceae bacterium]
MTPDYKKFVVMDTCILCTWLKVPGKETCGPDNNRWDFKRVDDEITRLIDEGAMFVLPLATIIETGNHIAQSNGHDKQYAIDRFTQIICDSIDANEPWTKFSEQSGLWADDALRNLATRWKPLAHSYLSLGDASIVDVANFYAQLRKPVEIFTADAGLQAYAPAPTPKRRQLAPPRRES